MTNNAKAYRTSHAWREALADIGAESRVYPPLPATDQREGREVQPHPRDEWAYIRPFHSSDERAAALPDWLHTYNHHRSHSALGGQPPISRTVASNAGGYNN
jgi:transposase InsO family protein